MAERTLNLSTWLLATILVASLMVFPAVEAHAEERTEITFWHIWGGNRVPIMEAAIEEFEQRNPDIKVNLQLQPTNAIRELVLTTLAGGDTPDLMMIYTTEFTMVAERGQLHPLDELMAADGVTPDPWIPGAWGMTQFGEKTYGLPSVINGIHLLYWNKDMFREAGLDPDRGPETWQELYDMTEQLHKRQGNRLEVIGYNPMGLDQFLKYLYLNDGEALSPDGREVRFNSPEAVETLTWLKSLVDLQGGAEALAAIAAEFQDAMGLQYPLFAGREALLYSGVFLINVIGDTAPDLDYGVAMMPVGPSGHGPTDLVFASWNHAIPAAAKNKEAAWRLAKWLSLEEGHQQFMAAQVRPAMVARYNESPYADSVKADNPWWDVIVEVMDAGVPMAVSPVSNQVDAVLREAIEMVYYDEMTVEEALEWAEFEAQMILDDYHRRR